MTNDVFFLGVIILFITIKIQLTYGAQTTTENGTQTNTENGSIDMNAKEFFKNKNLEEETLYLEQSNNAFKENGPNQSNDVTTLDLKLSDKSMKSRETEILNYLLPNLIDAKQESSADFFKYLIEQLMCDPRVKNNVEISLEYQKKCLLHLLSLDNKLFILSQQENNLPQVNFSKNISISDFFKYLVNILFCDPKIRNILELDKLRSSVNKLVCAGFNPQITLPNLLSDNQKYLLIPTIVSSNKDNILLPLSNSLLSTKIQLIPVNLKQLLDINSIGNPTYAQKDVKDISDIKPSTKKLKDTMPKFIPIPVSAFSETSAQNHLPNAESRNPTTHQFKQILEAELLSKENPGGYFNEKQTNSAENELQTNNQESLKMDSQAEIKNKKILPEKNSLIGEKLGMERNPNKLMLTAPEYSTDKNIKIHPEINIGNNLQVNKRKNILVQTEIVPFFENDSNTYNETLFPRLTKKNLDNDSNTQLELETNLAGKTDTLTQNLNLVPIDNNLKLLALNNFTEEFKENSVLNKDSNKTVKLQSMNLSPAQKIIQSNFTITNTTNNGAPKLKQFSENVPKDSKNKFINLTQTASDTGILNLKSSPTEFTFPINTTNSALNDSPQKTGDENQLSDKESQITTFSDTNSKLNKELAERLRKDIQNKPNTSETEQKSEEPLTNQLEDKFEKNLKKTSAGLHKNLNDDVYSKNKFLRLLSAVKFKLGHIRSNNVTKRQLNLPVAKEKINLANYTSIKPINNNEDQLNMPENVISKTNNNNRPEVNYIFTNSNADVNPLERKITSAETVDSVYKTENDDDLPVIKLDLNLHLNEIPLGNHPYEIKLNVYPTILLTKNGIDIKPHTNTLTKNVNIPLIKEKNINFNNETPIILPQTTSQSINNTSPIFKTPSNILNNTYKRDYNNNNLSDFNSPFKANETNDAAKILQIPLVHNAEHISSDVSKDNNKIGNKNNKQSNNTNSFEANPRFINTTGLNVISNKIYDINKINRANKNNSDVNNVLEPKNLRVERIPSLNINKNTSSNMSKDTDKKDKKQYDTTDSVLNDNPVNALNATSDLPVKKVAEKKNNQFSDKIMNEPNKNLNKSAEKLPLDFKTTRENSNVSNESNTNTSPSNQNMTTFSSILDVTDKNNIKPTNQSDKNNLFDSVQTRKDLLSKQIPKQKEIPPYNNVTKTLSNTFEDINPSDSIQAKKILPKVEKIETKEPFIDTVKKTSLNPFNRTDFNKNINKSNDNEPIKLVRNSENFDKIKIFQENSPTNKNTSPLATTPDPMVKNYDENTDWSNVNSTVVRKLEDKNIDLDKPKDTDTQTDKKNYRSGENLLLDVKNTSEKLNSDNIPNIKEKPLSEPSIIGINKNKIQPNIVPLESDRTRENLIRIPEVEKMSPSQDRNNVLTKPKGDKDLLTKQISEMNEKPLPKNALLDTYENVTRNNNGNFNSSDINNSLESVQTREDLVAVPKPELKEIPHNKNNLVSNTSKNNQIDDQNGNFLDDNILLEDNIREKLVAQEQVKIKINELNNQDKKGFTTTPKNTKENDNHSDDTNNLLESRKRTRGNLINETIPQINDLRLPDKVNNTSSNTLANTKKINDTVNAGNNLDLKKTSSENTTNILSDASEETDIIKDKINKQSNFNNLKSLNITKELDKQQIPEIKEIPISFTARDTITDTLKDSETNNQKNILSNDENPLELIKTSEKLIKKKTPDENPISQPLTIKRIFPISKNISEANYTNINQLDGNNTVNSNENLIKEKTITIKENLLTNNVTLTDHLKDANKNKQNISVIDLKEAQTNLGPDEIPKPKEVPLSGKATNGSHDSNNKIEDKLIEPFNLNSTSDRKKPSQNLTIDKISKIKDLRNNNTKILTDKLNNRSNYEILSDSMEKRGNFSTEKLPEIKKTDLNTKSALKLSTEINKDPIKFVKNHENVVNKKLAETNEISPFYKSINVSPGMLNNTNQNKDKGNNSFIINPSETIRNMDSILEQIPEIKHSTKDDTNNKSSNTTDSSAKTRENFTLEKIPKNKETYKSTDRLKNQTHQLSRKVSNSSFQTNLPLDLYNNKTDSRSLKDNVKNPIKNENKTEVPLDSELQSYFIKTRGNFIEKEDSEHKNKKAIDIAPKNITSKQKTPVKETNKPIKLNIPSNKARTTLKQKNNKVLPKTTNEPSKKPVHLTVTKLNKNKDSSDHTLKKNNTQRDNFDLKQTRKEKPLNIILKNKPASHKKSADNLLHFDKPNENSDLTEKSKSNQPLKLNANKKNEDLRKNFEKETDSIRLPIDTPNLNAYHKIFKERTTESPESENSAKKEIIIYRKLIGIPVESLLTPINAILLVNTKIPRFMVQTDNLDILIDEDYQHLDPILYSYDESENLKLLPAIPKAQVSPPQLYDIHLKNSRSSIMDFNKMVNYPYVRKSSAYVAPILSSRNQVEKRVPNIDYHLYLKNPPYSNTKTEAQENGMSDFVPSENSERVFSYFYLPPRMSNM